MFPIAVSDVGEGQRNRGWERFCCAAISEITNRRTTAQRRTSVGLFCFPALPAERIPAGPARVPRCGKTFPRRAPRAGNEKRRIPLILVGNDGEIVPCLDGVRPRKRPKGVVHADAFRRIVDPTDPSPHRIHFFNPGFARETQGGSLPPASPIPAGRGTVGAPLRLSPSGRAENNPLLDYKKYPTMPTLRRYTNE
jgi:hypothetical protein